MKKIKIALSVLLYSTYSLSLQAQTINKTYELPNFDLETKCIAEKVDDSAIFFTAIARPQSNPSVPDFLITKTDHNGNFISSVLIDSQYYESHRLISVDSGTLLAAFNNNDLHVIKFDLNLNTQWSKVIPLNSQYASQAYTFIDIERSYDEIGNEVYYIVNTAPAPVQSGYFGIDNVISVTKLSKYGNLNWHKLYTDNNRQVLPYTYLIDVPHSITSVDTNHYEFTIAGTRSVSDTSSGRNIVTENLFFLSIDKDGNVTSNYQELNTMFNYPNLPDIAWDSYNDLIVCSYKESPGSLPSPVTIGLVTMDKGLNPLSGNNYAFTCINSPNSITVSGDTSYIIGTFFQECGTTNPTYPGFLEINNSTLLPTTLARYNTQKIVVNNSYHVADNYGYKYMIPHTLRNFESARMIKADFSLYACGAEYDEINDTAYNPMPMAHDYGGTDVDSIYDFTFNYQNPSLDVDDCDTAYDKAKYKTPTVLNTNSNKFINALVYPTVVDYYSYITCQIKVVDDADAEIIVLNTLGQVSAKKHVKLGYGDNKILLNNNELSKGLNVIKIIVEGVPVNTSKVIVE